MQEEYYDMWLSRVNGISNRKMDLLYNEFGSAEEIFHASPQALRSSGLLDTKTALNLINDQDEALLASYIRALEAKSIRYISRFSLDYPLYLNDIPYPPAGLYILGTLPDNTLPKVSVIGSRRCSEYGLTTAHRLSKDLAAHGVVIVSGMARGIDSQAHRGALEAGGLTIAVLGCGVDMCYPAENRALKEKIVKSGCVVSEYPPCTPPLPAYFPARNRIISGLSRATIVVEAAKKSGTIITVEQALEQGRDVYAVPGNITSKLSQGTNDFIKQGATLISDYEDVLNNLGLSYDKEEESQNQTKKADGLQNVERLVYNCVQGEPVNLETIAVQTGLAVQKINAILILLEMEDFIKKLPGQRYIRN